jgi:hypothetical protein
VLLYYKLFHLFTWCVAILQVISFIDEDYGNNMIELDKRCANFPIIHSLDIWEGHRFRFDDLTQYFKGKPWEKDSQGSGFLKVLEGWKNVILLCYLLFSINKDMCPFEKNWCDGKIKNKWSIGGVIINALTATLEVHFAARQEILTKSGMATMNILINNARAHMSLLWILRKQLIIGYKTKHANVPTVANSIKELKGFYSGSKLHLITHLPEYKYRFGAFKKTIDTELSEHSHLDFVKKAYNHSNKKKQK